MGRGTWFCMIRVILEIELVYPYKNSMATLAEFCFLWNCNIISGGTRRLKAIISMPSNHFKRIFGSNPVVKEYKIPSGTEKFISALKVKKIVV